MMHAKQLDGSILLRLNFKLKSAGDYTVRVPPIKLENGLNPALVESHLISNYFLTLPHIMDVRQAGKLVQLLDRKNKQMTLPLNPTSSTEQGMTELYRDLEAGRCVAIRRFEAHTVFICPDRLIKFLLPERPVGGDAKLYMTYICHADVPPKILMKEPDNMDELIACHRERVIDGERAFSEVYLSKLFGVNFKSFKEQWQGKVVYVARSTDAKLANAFQTLLNAVNASVMNVVDPEKVNAIFVYRPVMDQIHLTPYLTECKLKNIPFFAFGMCPLLDENHQSCKPIFPHGGLLTLTTQFLTDEKGHERLTQLMDCLNAIKQTHGHVFKVVLHPMVMRQIGKMAQNKAESALAERARRIVYALDAFRSYHLCRLMSEEDESFEMSYDLSKNLSISMITLQIKYHTQYRHFIVLGHEHEQLLPPGQPLMGGIMHLMLNDLLKYFRTWYS